MMAFYQVAQTSSFTKAASRLHVTQSALSQRIAKLENDLEVTLFIRDRNAVKLTEMGLKLLRFCQAQEVAEDEMSSVLKGSQNSLGGSLRIAGFSSINRSVVIPALRKLVSSNDDLSLEILTREISDLDQLLLSCEVDYILTNRQASRGDVESVLLGFERNVLVGAKKRKTSKAIYLDHDANDPTTRQYFKAAKVAFEPRKIRYLDDVYGLIDGVKNGFGQAVLPLHLIEDDTELSVVKPDFVLKVPVYLEFHRQPFYRRIHGQVIAALQNCQL